MGSSSQAFLDFPESYSTKDPSPLLRKALKAQVTKRRLQGRKQKAALMKKGHIRSKRTRRVSRRSESIVDKRVRTLRKLIPKSESVGLDGLFRHTADYILSLQMRVKVMQIMVKPILLWESRHTKLLIGLICPVRFKHKYPVQTALKRDNQVKKYPGAPAHQLPCGPTQLKDVAQLRLDCLTN
ncbi:uncharacterized protein LOC127813570 [Diospyros lotus]|uniref:uncharacterized protein LOC127813570 n=1 Tax=Diospyros lotus TaxID=55363 RepID=UPI0022514899|nr:uncharacterized protein LOC127813570 [Diospyros lotus]